MATTPASPILLDSTGGEMVRALERIAAASEAANGTASAPAWDAEAGCYTNASIASWLATKASGGLFGYSMPKGSATALTRLGTIASRESPVPSTCAAAGTNPYADDGDFFWCECNAEVNDDGTAKVTAIRGDGRFARDGSNGDVWVLTHTYYARTDESDEAVDVWLSASAYGGGLDPQPGAKLPDGSVRPFMLYAKYAGCKGADGYMHSYSGHPLWTRDVSHDSLITQTRCATTGYSGKTAADDWYVTTMYRLMFATKSNPSVMPGCISYSQGYAPAIAETGVTRVVLTTAQAASFVVGSSVMLGTGNGDGTTIDRGNAKAYDVFDARRILSIEAVDDSTSALNVEGEAFDTGTTMWLQTAPWRSGCCDSVPGGLGCPTSYTSQKEPFVIQGIECMLGAYEVLGNVIISNDGATGWVPYVNHDTKAEAKSLTDAYVACGAALPTDDADSWKYPLWDAESQGLLVPRGTGGSTGAGLCDGACVNKLTATGTREWLFLGGLWNGASAGLRCVNAGNGLGWAGWYIASRISGNGRSRG